MPDIGKTTTEIMPISIVSTFDMPISDLAQIVDENTQETKRVRTVSELILGQEVIEINE